MGAEEPKQESAPEEPKTEDTSADTQEAEDDNSSLQAIFAKYRK
jgi:hypothetical protein